MRVTLLLLAGACARDGNPGDSAAAEALGGPGADSSAASAAPSPAPILPAARRDTLWLFAKDPADDGVHASDTETDLVGRYGAEFVSRDTLAPGEGGEEIIDATVLFAKDSTRRLEVIWGDTRRRSRPTYAGTQVRGSRWVAYPGVGIGSCMEEIETLNGGPFTLFGFGWDYSGTIDGWQGGRLDSLWQPGGPKRVMVRFARSRRSVGRDVGDRVFSTTDPVMRAARPCVRELFIRPR